MSKPSRIPGLVLFSRVDPLLHATLRRSNRKISRAHDLRLCRDFEHAWVGTLHYYLLDFNRSRLYPSGCTNKYHPSSHGRQHLFSPLQYSEFHTLSRFHEFIPHFFISNFLHVLNEWNLAVTKYHRFYCLFLFYIINEKQSNLDVDTCTAHLSIRSVPANCRTDYQTKVFID